MINNLLEKTKYSCNNDAHMNGILGAQMHGILIVGPTASGKSSLALECAKELFKKGLNPVIINADSMQVYDSLPILSAQPTDFDMKQVKHFLYSYKKATDSCNVYYWLDDVEKILQKCISDGLYPIVTGGTGLYINALLNGLHILPAYNENTRWEQKSLEECLFRLREIDPKYSNNIQDKRRLMRALDLYDQTGYTPTQLYSQPKNMSLTKKFNIIWEKRYLEPQNLKDRIMLRLKKDILKMIAEVNACRNEVIGTAVENTIGYSEICMFLDVELTYETVVEKIYYKTCQYSKRQKTWFRKYFSC